LDRHIQKATELVASDFPVNDLNKYNYANLRAARGRLNPYEINYVEIGNEPYYAEYDNNPEGFAQFYIAQCRAIKTIKSDIQCVIPVQSSHYEDVLKYIIDNAGGEGLVAGVGTHDYFQHLNPNGGYYDTRKEASLRSMAGP
jgi:alpha-L-arabinofuranosidase